MKMLITLAFALILLSSPMVLRADETVTESAIVTEGAITPLEENLSIVDYLRENVFTTEFFAAVSGFSMFILLGIAKGFLSSNKKFNLQSKSLVDRGKDILEMKSSLTGTWADVKEVLSANKLLSKKVEKMEQTEDFLVDLMKDFIRSTSISVDDKIEIAKKFDKFNSLLNASQKTSINLKEDALVEFTDTIKKQTLEAEKKTDTYLEKLKSLSDNDTSR